VGHGIRPVDDQRQGQQGQGHHQGRPHRHRQPRAEAAGRHRAGGGCSHRRAAAPRGPAGCDVPHRPGGRRGDDEDQAEGRGRDRAPHRDHAETHRAHEHPHDLRAAGPLAQGQGGDHDGESDLRLQDERGQAGRHPDRQGRVEQRELPQAHEQAHQQHVAPRDPWSRHEEDRREQHDDEPQRHEQGRWQVAQAQVDDDEVGAPDHRDEHGEGDVAGRHPTILAEETVKHQQRLLDPSR